MKASCAVTTTLNETFAVAVAGIVVNASLVAVPAATVIVFVVAPVKPVAAMVMVLAPEVFMVTETVPAPLVRVVGPGRVACGSVEVKVTLPAKEVAVLLSASFAIRLALNAVPAVAVDGTRVQANWVAAPAAILKVVLVAVARPVEVAERVYPLPDLLMFKPEKVATPEVAASEAVPERVPAAGFVPMATAIVAVDVVTVFPFAS